MHLIEYTNVDFQHSKIGIKFLVKWKYVLGSVSNLTNFHICSMLDFVCKMIQLQIIPTFVSFLYWYSSISLFF